MTTKFWMKHGHWLLIVGVAMVVAGAVWEWLT